MVTRTVMVVVNEKSIKWHQFFSLYIYLYMSLYIIFFKSATLNIIVF